MKYSLIFLVLSHICFLSCLDESRDLLEECTKKNKVSLSIEDFKFEATTRTAVTLTENGPVFAWTDKDTISIYPDQGSQVEFLAEASEGASTDAYFDGGAWALKQGHSFCAFYPYDFYNRSANNITLDYSGQSQLYNSDYTEACKKDYFYSGTVLVEKDAVWFTFKHLGIFLNLALTVPKDVAFTSVSLCCEDEIFPIKQKLDLTSGEPVTTTLTKDYEISLALQNICVSSEDEILSVALFLPAIDLSNKEIYVTAVDNTGKNYTSKEPVSLPSLTSGYAYLRHATLVDEDSPEYIDPHHYSINYLAIGNSFSIDALGYTPSILEELLPNADINIGIAYYPAGSLEQQCEIINNSLRVYQYYSYYSKDKTWKKSASYYYTKCLEEKDWDIISFQQTSSLSAKYSTYQPFLSDLISRAKEDIKDSKIVWVQTHSYADGYQNCNSDEMFLSIAEASKSVIDNTSISELFPYGAAIQNARHTTIDRFGDFVSSDKKNKGHLTYEGMHIQAGLSRLVASYVMAQKILDIYDIPASISQSTYQISAENDLIIQIPTNHGEIVEPAQRDYKIAKLCALEAIKNPYSITVIPDATGSIKDTPWDD